MPPPTSPLRPDEIRPLVQESVPWSPLDFIRHVSVDGDRQVQFDGLLRALDPANDLRFVVPISRHTEAAVFAERLPWDSQFFGYGVARLQGVFPVGAGRYTHDADYRPAIGALLDLARARGIRYLFGVIDARDLPTLRALTELSFVLIEARLYYHVALREFRYPRRHRCRPATPADVDALVEMAGTVDNPYDRFNSDPFIGRENARRLMAQWVRASVLDGFADLTIIPDSPTPGSLVTLKYHEDKAAAWESRVAQKMLAIATPRMGNGWIHVVTETLHHAKERGWDHVMFTTQLANRRLIRTGEHAGYRFGRGEYVFRMVL
jgi:dTDP-4-amino-4,6-dideoxy-D-galactose acyltransferase